MGKSATARMFAEAGVPVHDADASVHKLYDGAAVAPIEAAFPGSTRNGSVDRTVLGAQVVGKYDAPKQQWLPGHRGVDLLADPQEAIVAPADGVIAFSGNVGGKAVVTIRHGGDLSGLTSTFEPAIAERDVGAHVAQGERFARVEGESDHCDERCLHWGIKSEGRQYTNPESKTRTVRIGLKGL